MSNDLEVGLRDVAALLDERWEQHVRGEPPVLALIEDAPRASMVRGARLGLVATVSVLIGLLVLGVMARGSEPPPAAPTDGDAVALVPGTLDGWGTARTWTTPWPRMPQGQLIIVAPTSGRDRLGRSVMISVVSPPFPGALSERDGEEASGSGLVGRVERFNIPDRRVVLQTDIRSDAGATRRVVVSAGPDSDVDVLFELAASVDPDLSMADHVPPNGWEVIRLVQGTYRPTRTYQGFEGEHFDGSSYIAVVTLTNASEADVWLLAPPFLGAEVEIRGRTARVVAVDGRGVRITWAERDDMVVHVEYYNHELEGTALIERARGEVEGLVPVDEQGWLDLPRPHPTSD